MGLTNFQLKIIALITMTIDHIGYILFPNIILLRIIGRISFIIFAFLLVEGFNKTSDRTRYITVIGVFGFAISIGLEIINTFMTVYAPPNIFLTLFFALLLMLLLEKKKMLYYVIAFILFLFISPNLDYSYYGISIILVFYFKSRMNWSDLLTLIIFLVVTLFYVYVTPNLMITTDNSYLNFMLGNSSISYLQIYGVFGLIITFFYNNQRGYYNIYVKYMIYLYYPIHLILLYGLSIIL